MIHIKTKEDMLEYKATAGCLSKQALRVAGAMIKPGVSTREIDAAVEGFIRLHGATPGFKGYGGFPGSVCASVNEQIVHGIPSPEVFLNDGDIISIDVGANKCGWAGDNAWTFYVGNVSDEVKGLCECTRDCLKAGIEQAVPGNHLGDIGFAVQELAESNGYGVVREYVAPAARRPRDHRQHDHARHPRQPRAQQRLDGRHQRRQACRALREHDRHHRGRPDDPHRGRPGSLVRHAGRGAGRRVASRLLHKIARIARRLDLASGRRVLSAEPRTRVPLAL